MVSTSHARGPDRPLLRARRRRLRARSPSRSPRAPCSDGTEATNISASEGYWERGPSFSRDGRRIFFSRQRRTDQGKWENPDVWVVNVDGTDQVQLTQNPSFDGAPVEGPDGYVYFLSDRGALVNGKHPQRIWRMQVLEAR